MSLMHKPTQLLATLALLASGCFAASPARAMEIMVPAYFYPSFDPAQSQWDEMQAALASGVPVTAIMNVFNGPGTAANSDYRAAVDQFRAAGGRVLGYVYTCYGNNTCTSGVAPTRSTTEVLADVQRYADWYAIDGIFFDEMAADVAAANFYRTVTDAVRAAHADWRLVGNPGTAIPQALADMVDTVVTFEQGRGDYSQATTAPWMIGAPPSRQAHLHYNVDSEAQMRLLLAEAATRGAGSIYITDDRYTPGSPVDTNPFDRLPSYWAAEVAAVAAFNARVPEPGTVLLIMAALGGLAVSQQGRRARAPSLCNAHRQS
jgi:Spherulation-specific family 4